MKVLIVHNRYQQRGGEDRVVDDEIGLLRHHGHQVETLIEDNRALDAVPAWRQAGDLLWSRDAAARVRCLCQDFQPDVMHCHNTHARLSPSVIRAARECGVPVVQTVHNYRLLCVNAMLLRDGRPCQDCVGHLPWRGVLHACYRGSTRQSAALAAGITLHRALGSHSRHVTRFIALSEHARQTLIRGGLPAQRTVVKPNFVNDPLGAARALGGGGGGGGGGGESSAGDATTRHGLLYVGRLSAEKGIDWLMQASAHARRRVSVMGDGPMQAACRAHPWFDCLGERPMDEVFAAMRRARALVVPSLSFEAMPRVLVEAFACGLPIIASRQGALAELVEHGRTGWLVETGNVDALAQAMLGAETSADWAGMSGQARVTYQSKYTSDVAHDALLAIYRQAMAHANPQASAMADDYAGAQTDAQADIKSGSP